MRRFEKGERPRYGKRGDRKPSFAAARRKDVDSALDVICLRFGIDRKVFKDYSFIRKRDSVWLTSRRMFSSEIPSLNIEAAGMLFVRVSRTVKPTTNAIQLLDRHITRNRLELEKEKLDAFIRGLDVDLGETELSDGYVAVCHDGRAYGCGLLKGTHLKSQVPISRRIKRF